MFLSSICTGTDDLYGARLVSVTEFRLIAPSLHFFGAEQDLHVDHTLCCNVAPGILQHYCHSCEKFRGLSTEIVWRKFWDTDYSTTMAVQLKLWVVDPRVACQSFLVIRSCFDLSV